MAFFYNHSFSVHLSLKKIEDSLQTKPNHTPIKNNKMAEFPLTLTKTVVFTDPQVAWVGLREDEALARNLDPLVEEYPFADHGKSLLMEAPRGYVKVIADRASGKIVGAECVGKDASELIHALTVPVAHGLTPAQCMEADWYHPTLAEIWTYPLEDLAEALATG